MSALDALASIDQFCRTMVYHYFGEALLSEIWFMKRDEGKSILDQEGITLILQIVVVCFNIFMSQDPRKRRSVIQPNMISDAIKSLRKVFAIKCQEMRTKIRTSGDTYTRKAVHIPPKATLFSG